MLADLKKQIGEQVRTIRKLKGLTQESLADRSGVSFSYISDVERGTRNISLVSLEKIMHALEINADEMFKYEYDDRHPLIKETRLLLKKVDDRLSVRPLPEVKFMHHVIKKFADMMDT